MTDPHGPRRFDDEEVALILRRAAELDAAQRTGVADRGLTLADVEAAAREAGLDPALVRRAASELPARGLARPQGLAAKLIGAPTTLRFERLVDGEYGVHQAESIVEEIRRTLADVGVASALGATLGWSTTPSARPGRAGGRVVNVTVVARGGRTAIRVEESARGLAGGVFGGIVGGVGGSGAGLAAGIGIGVMHAPVIALGVWAATLAGSYSLARLVYLGLVRRRADELSGLADRIAAMVRQDVG